MKKSPAVVFGVLTLCFSLCLGILFYIRRSAQPSISFGTVPVTTQAYSQRLDINEATFHELCSLPGIGQELARRIIDYRTNNGPFSSLMELLQVKGMGEKRLEAIWDLITV